jgi:hypothetical protein
MRALRLIHDGSENGESKIEERQGNKEATYPGRSGSAEAREPGAVVALLVWFSGDWLEVDEEEKPPRISSRAGSPRRCGVEAR